MKSSIRKWLCLSVLIYAFSMAGCFRANQYVAIPVKNNSSKPIIYIFGEIKWEISDIEVYSNDRMIGVIGSKSYLYWAEEPSTITILFHPLRSTWIDKSVDCKFSFKAEEYGKYYFQVDRYYETEKAPIGETLAMLPVNIALKAALGEQGVSGMRSVKQTEFLLVKKLTKEEALELIKKRKPPELVIPK